MTKSVIRYILAGSLALSSPATFAAQTTEVRVETGKHLGAVCKAYLAMDTRETENALVPADPCRAYLAGFASAYGIGQSASLDARVRSAAPSPPPPSAYKMDPWAKPEARSQSGGPSAAPPEDMACFVLPAYLSYRDFAQLVVDFLSTHAEYNDQPAYIATAAALAEKYPCK